MNAIDETCIQFTSKEIFERDKWKCCVCKKKVDQTLVHPHPKSPSLEHLVPLSRGGKHCATNVALSHLTCNLTKSTKTLEELLR